MSCGADATICKLSPKAERPTISDHPPNDLATKADMAKRAN
jgi:hypothetical protein